MNRPTDPLPSRRSSIRWMGLPSRGTRKTGLPTRPGPLKLRAPQADDRRNRTPRSTTAHHCCGLLLVVACLTGSAVHAAQNPDKAGAAKPAGERKATVPTSWPSFRNGNEQQGIATSSLPSKLELLWTHEAGDIIKSTAAIVGPHVYAASLKGEVFCLDRATGKRVWTCRSKEDKNPKAFLPGFKSSPLVTDDTVYLGDEDGVFHAIDRATGKHRWKFETSGEIVSSATLFGDRVLFGSHDNSLYCVQVADGSKVWQFMTDGMVNCSPAIAGSSTFVTGCDEHLRIIDILTAK